MIPVGAAAGHFSLARRSATACARSKGSRGDLGATVPNRPFREPPRDASEVKPLWHVGAHKTTRRSSISSTTSPTPISRWPRSEGFVSVEHLKRYTTLGMATDQGKTSQLNGHALLAAATGRSIAETGTILSRPPYTPVAIGAFAGHHRDEDFRPERRTASHQWAIEQGASFVDAGLWKRAQWFAAPGRTRLAGDRQPGGNDDPERRRHLRRLDPRQDRRPWARTPAGCSTGSISTHSRRFRSARRATASCCARMAS